MVEEMGQDAAVETLDITPDWDSVRQQFEGGDGTVREICDRHGITQAQLHWRRKTQRWTPRTVRPASRSALISRMLMLFERQVKKLEEQVEETMKPDSGEPERKTALLHNMARTLEKLMALEAAERGMKAKTKPTDITHLRERLAKRIEDIYGE